MKAKYKGYLAKQNKDNSVTISKDDIVEAEIQSTEKYSVKELRTLINKHIKAKE